MGNIAIPFFLTFLAGISTVAGGLIFLSNNLCKRKFIGFFLGLSAGVMIYLSFVELFPYAVENLGFIRTNILFFVGIAIMTMVDFILPHHYLEERVCKKYNVVDRKFLSTGFVVTIGLLIHNFPEGVAVFLSSFTDLRLGVLLAFAITIHNIPEGIAVATPIYQATKSKKQAVKYALISGMAEPMGAIISYFFLRSYISQDIISYIFAIVAGVMIYISFDELLPSCFRDDQGHRAIAGIIVGMFVVSISLTAS